MPTKLAHRTRRSSPNFSMPCSNATSTCRRRSSRRCFCRRRTPTPTSIARSRQLANRCAKLREGNTDAMAMSSGRMMRFAAIGFEFAWPMIAGAILGHYLDLYFHTDPWLTLVMFLLGVFIGFYRLIQELALFQRENRES